MLCRCTTLRCAHGCWLHSTSDVARAALSCSNSQNAFPIHSRIYPKGAAAWTVAFSLGSPTLFRSCRTRLGNGRSHRHSARISRRQTSRAGLSEAEAFHELTPWIGNHLLSLVDRLFRETLHPERLSQCRPVRRMVGSGNGLTPILLIAGLPAHPSTASFA